MPNIKSAKKRVKVTATKTLQNRMIKGQLKAAYKTIDQSAAKGIIHKNKAARKKAQVAAKVAAKA